MTAATTTTAAAKQAGTDHNGQPADVIKVSLTELSTADFLQAIFAPGDRFLIRPIETWTEADRKKSTVDYRGVQYVLVGSKDHSQLFDLRSRRLLRQFPPGARMLRTGQCPLVACQ